MSWFTSTLTSTIGRKLIAGLTGLFLISFLIVHLAGNLQLLSNDGGEAFNVYAKFMTTNPVIKALSYVLYAGILIHIVWTLALTFYNRSARPVGYAVNAGGTNSSWASRNMAILGTIILVFLVIHLKDFWYVMKFGSIPMVSYEGEQYKDLYTVVSTAFDQTWYVILYVICMVGLGFHLAHGFQSSFQTLGVNHPKYTPAIKFIGIVFSLIVPILYAAIPILMYLN